MLLQYVSGKNLQPVEELLKTFSMRILLQYNFLLLLSNMSLCVYYAEFYNIIFAVAYWIQPSKNHIRYEVICTGFLDHICYKVLNTGFVFLTQIFEFSCSCTYNI